MPNWHISWHYVTFVLPGEVYPVHDAIVQLQKYFEVFNSYPGRRALQIREDGQNMPYEFAKFNNINFWHERGRSQATTST